MELVSAHRDEQEMPGRAPPSAAGLATYDGNPESNTRLSNGHMTKSTFDSENEHDIVSRLYSACLDSLQQILRDMNPAFVRKRDLNLLRRVLSTLKLWGDGYGAGTGVLNAKLQRSKHLYSTTLSLLRSLCRSIQQGLTEVILFHLETAEAITLRAACIALTDETRVLLTNARRKSSRGSSGGTSLDHSDRGTNRDDQKCTDSDVEEDSDSDSDDDDITGSARAEDCIESPWFTAFVSEVLLCTTCLTDLGTALDCPAISPRPLEDTESIALWADQVPSGANATKENTKPESVLVIAERDTQRSTLPVDDTVAPIPYHRVPFDVSVSREEQEFFTPWLGYNLPVDLPVDVLAAQEEKRAPFPRRFFDSAPSDDSVPKEEPRSIDPPALTQDRSVERPNDGWKSMIPTLLLDYSYEETFRALNENGPFTVLDLKDVDHTWALRSRPGSPTDTPDLSSSNTTPSTRQSDAAGDDNLMINIGVDMPDTRMVPMHDDMINFGMPFQDDLQTLGMSLPPLDNYGVMQFSSLLDFEAVEKQMDGSLGGPEAGIY